MSQAVSAGPAQLSWGVKGAANGIGGATPGPGRSTGGAGLYPGIPNSTQKIDKCLKDLNKENVNPPINTLHL